MRRLSLCKIKDKKSNHQIFWYFLRKKRILYSIKTIHISSTNKKSHSAILMSLHPNAVSILAMVCMVKLCLPVNHLDISDSLLWSFWAKSFWVRFFAFRTSLMRSAIPNESSNSAFCSSGIAARHCLNKAFCIIIVDLINCLCLYCWSFHRGSSCQLLDGKPMAAMLYFIKIKRPADLSIVERLGGFLCCKGTTFIWVVQVFGEKSDDLTGVFNSCWVFGRAKCSIYKSMWDNWRTKHEQRWACSIYAMQGGRRRKSDYKLYLGMWKDGANFA